MKKVFSVDRIEGDIAVCISDDDIKLDINKEILGGMTVNDVFSAELDGESISDVVPMPEERDRRLKRNRERLQRLFDRSKRT
jgi:hypothetical protein